MKYQSIKTFLISIFLNLIFISIIYAQGNLTSLIIQNRIDRIWTTGQLNIDTEQIQNLTISMKNLKKPSSDFKKNIVYLPTAPLERIHIRH
jgi:hypothetical protein